MTAANAAPCAMEALRRKDRTARVCPMGERRKTLWERPGAFVSGRIRGHGRLLHRV